ncbi:hypothetical protein ACRPHP_13430 [Pantoea allii]|uniref:hypothetical protein n=1 Tax=Pantoea allii TaxID=574096 RepID=UPI003D7B30C6
MTGASRSSDIGVAEETDLTMLSHGVRPWQKPWLWPFLVGKAADCGAIINAPF